MFSFIQQIFVERYRYNKDNYNIMQSCAMVEISTELLW